jgi:hypothetical protein
LQDVAEPEAVAHDQRIVEAVFRGDLVDDSL